jgi:hypothetical protein
VIPKGKVFSPVLYPGAMTMPMDGMTATRCNFLKNDWKMMSNSGCFPIVPAQGVGYSYNL